MSWLDKLKEYAPDIASAVITGGATLLPSALNILAKETGLPITDKASLEKAVNQADTDTMLKMKEADNKFKVEMRQLSNELTATELGDVQHARDSHKHSLMPAAICIALTFMVAALGCLFAVWCNHC